MHSAVIKVHVRASGAVGGVGAEEGVGAAGDDTADVGMRSSATMLTSPTRLVACCATPSRATIAGHAIPLAAAGAMFAIDRAAGTMDKHTQHRPWQLARTGAPWHTLNATPPGRPPERTRTAPPVGRARGHRDDDCATAPTLSGVRAPSVVPRRGGGRETVVVQVGVRALVGGDLLDLRACIASSAPRHFHSPLSSFFLPSAPVLFFILSALLPAVPLRLVTDTANASLHNLVGKSAQLETVAVLTSLVLTLPYADNGAYDPSVFHNLISTAGPIAAVVGVTFASNTATRHVETLTIAAPRLVPSTFREVHVRCNLDGSSARRTWTSAGLLLAEVQAPMFLLLRAFRDVGAGVHVGVTGSRAFGA